MKMINAGTALITDYSNFQYNCILSRCKRKFFVPVPTLADVQLYVNFGPNKPESLVWTLIEACAYDSTGPLESGCFKIAFNGTDWYGVFRNFSSTSNFNLFSIGLVVTYEDSSTVTFFSEQYELPTAGCAPFTKISVCYPTNYNADDINGIYVGQHDTEETYSGDENLIYQHRFWVRDAEVIEAQNQITFKANSSRNFATTLNKIFEFRYELVPGWYKDYLLSVFFRGNFIIGETATKASELNFENVLEEADLWKAYVKLDKELKGSFGCAAIECGPICPDVPCVPVTMELGALPEAYIGEPFEYTHPILGTAPFSLDVTSKPGWMTVAIVGSNVVFSGTPDEAGTGDVVFEVTNECGEQPVSADYVVSETYSYLDCNNYFIGALGDGITDVCTLGFNWERSTDAQQDAEDDNVKVKCTVYILMDNGCSTEVDVEFLPNETIVAVHGVNLNCNSEPCSSIVDIHCVNLEIVE